MNRIETLETALRKYGQHVEPCAFDELCDCGLSAALAGEEVKRG